jgi:hypothetical protein
VNASIQEYHGVARPFEFVSCLELREVLGKRAMDIARLLELVEDVALDSIYCHTPSFYLRHAHPQTSYLNDFATWAARCVGSLRVSVS